MWQAQSYVDSCFSEIHADPGGRPKSASIRIKVSVPELRTAYTIPCGSGEQTVKWLALVVSQRIGSRNSSIRGERRTYERAAHKFLQRDRQTAVHFLVPGEILFKDQVIDPLMRVCDVFEDGDSCVIGFFANDLGTTRNTSFSASELTLPKVHGQSIPKTYLSPFAQRAFYSRSSQALNDNMALKQAVQDSQKNEVAVSRWEKNYKHKQKRHSLAVDDLMAAKFRSIMSNQTDTAVHWDETNDDIVQGQLLRHVFIADESFKEIDIHGLDASAGEIAKCKELVAENVEMLENVFRYYAGYLSSGQIASISEVEFTHFIEQTDVLQLSDTLKPARIEALFYGRHHVDTRLELDFAHFLERVIFVAAMNLGEQKLGQGALCEALAAVLEGVRRTYGDKGGDSELGEAMGDVLVQALFARHIDTLQACYTYYAGADGSKGRPTMSFEEFRSLIDDSGLVPGTEDGGEKLAGLSIRQAFSQAQQSAELEGGGEGNKMSESIFSEFLESLARVALAKWPTEDPFATKIAKTITAVIGTSERIPPKLRQKLLGSADIATTKKPGQSSSSFSTPPKQPQMSLSSPTMSMKSTYNGWMSPPNLMKDMDGKRLIKKGSLSPIADW